MEGQSEAAIIPEPPRVKVWFSLGSEKHSASANQGALSEQLTALKEASMGILKDYITKHNVPNDVPDEPLEISSDDDNDNNQPPANSKKTKIY